MADIILEMKNISKSFSGVHALKGLDFELRLGEVHALLGENGAGKSTLIKVLGGIHQPDTGSIVIAGEPVMMKNVHAAQARGIGIIHQEIVLVPHLSVAQNIFLGREPTTAGLTNIRHIEAEARRMVAALGLDIDVTRPVASLSIAKQQMVEIVKDISLNVISLVMCAPTW
ncbi:MAG: ATP-binding cassette domain-containing protein, partial [Planctomycetes bacterium]|nr:ATP-binding cassette domain-containing protein [Planctomycetota bacterium]